MARPVLLCALVTLLGLVGAPPATAGALGVTLVSAGASAIRFAVEVPAIRLAGQTAADDSTFTAATAAAGVRIELDGYEVAPGPDDPGLPVRVILVAVPPLGRVQVSGSGSEAETHDDVLLEGLSARVGATGAIPEAWKTAAPRARLLKVGWMRNQRIAYVEVHPADYDVTTRQLTLYRHLDVTVQVEAVGDLGPAAEDPDPFERVYRNALLNYEQGRSWRRPSTRRLAALGALRPEGLAGFASAAPESSVYFGRPWIKIAVADAGFYTLSYSELRNLGLFETDDKNDSTTWAPMDSLRLFTWPGVPVLPKDSYCDSCDYREVAISVKDDGDGKFGNNSDYFLFYAMGPSDWASLYDSTRADTVFVNHPYATTNYYYLARATDELPIGGTPARIELRDGTTATTVPTHTSFPARVHLEQDTEYYPNASPLYSSNNRNLFWEKWFWRAVKKGNQVQISVDLPGAETSLPVRLRALVWGLNYNSGGSLLDHYVDVSFNGYAFARRGFDDLLAQVYDATFTDLRESGNVFTMSVPDTTDPGNSSRSDVCGLAWFDLFYQRRFEPVNGRLDFNSPGSSGGAEVYRVGPFPDTLATPRVFDVTDPCRPIEFTGLRYELQESDSSNYLGFQADEPGRRRYRVLPADSVVAMTTGLADAPSVSVEQNLRSRTQQADYIVIYYDAFAAAAESLATWRRSVLPLAGVSAPYTAKIVPISALYDQFSGGRTDPAAIRNFLRAAYYNWNDGGAPRRPAFVTLLADASYDFKNLKGLAGSGQPGCLLPTYEDNFDVSSLVRKQYATDDWLLNVDTTAVVIPDLLGGRIPVDDATTALSVVRGKVLAHERSGELGEWRDRVMLIADDDRKGSAVDGLGWSHVRQTAILDSLHTPRHMDRDYIYLHTYTTGPGYTKPGAKADIKQGIADGVALVNFVGHGSPYQLADEKVLLDTDVGTLANAPRFPVFIAASCDVGKFSDPTVESLGERMLSSTTGGAVSVISATEEAISGYNADMNQGIYDALFLRDTVSCQYHVTVAEALLSTKAGKTNEQKYQLMGDAASCAALPHLWVELAVTDSAGNAATGLQRGGTFHFSGRVVDCPGDSGTVSLDGSVAMLIEDSQERETASSTTAGTATYYTAPGAIFRGDAGVTGGTFTGSFVVPLEAREGLRGRVRAYVQGVASGASAEVDGVGAVTMTVLAGEAPTGDVSGPRIGLSFVGGSTTVRPDAVLSVDLYDESGILTTNHTPQNGVIVTIDGSTTTRADITESFRYAANSYQSGTASYALPDLAEGAHTVTVSAADNLAAGLSAGTHRSHASLDFTVVAQPNLQITHAYLFPNPTESGGGRSGGQFVVDAPGDSVNVLLRIYTVSGRLIRTLTWFGGMGQIQLPWDGLDEEGQPLANGVYFFRAHVNLRDADGSSSAAQKDDADGRFVIVNRN